MKNPVRTPHVTLCPPHFNDPPIYIVNSELNRSKY